MYKLKIPILLIIFVCMITLIYRGDSKEYKKWDVLLNNNVVIRGKVLNIKHSLNHDFGIILLELDSTNLKEFSGRTTGQPIYPYKIKDGKAELYVPLPPELATGDKVVVNSNERIGGGYDVDTLSKEKSFSIYMLRDDNNLDYVRKNTDLK
jgi:hypothetical protein